MNGAKGALPSHAAMPPRKGPLRLTAYQMLLGAVVCVGILAGGLMLSLLDQHQPPIAERGTESGADIVPASGPPETGNSDRSTDTATPAETQDWGTAPELTPLQTAPKGTD